MQTVTYWKWIRNAPISCDSVWVFWVWWTTFQVKVASRKCFAWHAHCTPHRPIGRCACPQSSPPSAALNVNIIIGDWVSESVMSHESLGIIFPGVESKLVLYLLSSVPVPVLCWVYELHQNNIYIVVPQIIILSFPPLHMLLIYLQLYYLPTPLVFSPREKIIHTKINQHPQ